MPAPLYQPGKFRWPARIERPVGDHDDYAPGLGQSWELVGMTMCSLDPVSGEERVHADQVHGQVTHKVRMPFRDGLSPTFRLVFTPASGQRVFEVRSVVDVGEARRVLELMCVERR